MATVALTNPFHCSFQHHHRLRYNSKTCTSQSRYRPGEVINIRSEIKSNSKPDFVIKISGLCRKGRVREAVDALYAMEQRGVPVDPDVYAYLLQVCANTKSLTQGKRVHDHMLHSSVEYNLLLAGKLVAMYAMCQSLDDARLVFEKTASNQQHAFLWNSMIKGCVQNELWEEALQLYCQMHEAGIQPESYTFSSVLRACAALAHIERGKEIHTHIIINGLQSNLFVGNALVTLYAQCQRIVLARQVFDNMCERDVVSWTAIIAGNARCGYPNEALKLFGQMQQDGTKPNSITLTTVLPACGRLAALKQGKEVHNYIIRLGFEYSVPVGSALVDMYSQCGSVEAARQVFDKMPERNIVSWTAMIAGYGMNGHGKEVLKLFDEMQKAGLKPNHITLVVLLSACSHAGLVAEGWKYFNSMSMDYHITPTVEHFACMVDLLGRAGYLDEAESIVKTMPVQANAGVWGALLGACRIHCNVMLGECVARCLFELEPENAGNYILLANIYATTGQWGKVEEVRKLMKDRGLKPKQGCSWIEINNKVHTFYVRDRSHPQSEEIYAMLESLTRKMKLAGYTPTPSSVLGDLE